MKEVGFVKNLFLALLFAAVLIINSSTIVATGPQLKAGLDSSTVAVALIFLGLAIIARTSK